MMQRGRSLVERIEKFGPVDPALKNRLTVPHPALEQLREIDRGFQEARKILGP